MSTKVNGAKDMSKFDRGATRQAGSTMSRQGFLKRTAMGAGGLWLGHTGAPAQDPVTAPPAIKEYKGPNIVLVRFGRRRETIDREHTYSPYLLKDLAPKGTLYRNMMIEQFKGGMTSHGQGTLYMLTGVYEKFKNAGKFLEEKFETSNPTIFEYLRRKYRLPDHQTLIINGEDRTQEEFYSFSNHHLFGAQFKSETLSLFRFKLYVLRQKLANGDLRGEERKQAEKKIREMENHDYRTKTARQAPEIEAFWDKWQEHYGRSGFVNPRGDRLLTELTLWAMKHLQPRLVMVNYNDPDYVHLCLYPGIVSVVLSASCVGRLVVRRHGMGSHGQGMVDHQRSVRRGERMARRTLRGCETRQTRFAQTHRSLCHTRPFLDGIDNGLVCCPRPNLFRAVLCLPTASCPMGEPSHGSVTLDQVYSGTSAQTGWR